MITRIVAACARRPYVVLAAAALTAAAGYASQRGLARDAIPDLSNPQLVLVAEWMGHSAPEVASQVTEVLTGGLEGVPGSIVFVPAGGKCVPLGLSRQLSGDPGFGASGNCYCGSIIAPADELFVKGRSVESAALALAHVVAAEFHLLGLNGIDFVAGDGIPYPVEVNPRWSASVEVAERACDATFFRAHADACDSGALPAFDCREWLFRSAAVGKAIVYARRACWVGDTDSWLRDPALRDVPRSGESFRSGQPVCSVLTTAADSQACYRALVDRAERVYADLSYTERHTAQLLEVKAAAGYPSN